MVFCLPASRSSHKRPDFPLRNLNYDRLKNPMVAVSKSDILHSNGCLLFHQFFWHNLLYTITY